METPHATNSRFLEICARAGADCDGVSLVWDNLATRYSEPHRHYHNLAHIDRMLAHLDRIAPGEICLELAIWFHDSIYDPLAGDNEAQSTRFFAKELGAELPKSLVDQVKRLILATDPKQQRSGLAKEDLMIDIDLSILGAIPADYWEYCMAIRKEYSAVPDLDFVKGRIAILENFLLNPIFATECFAHLESQARANLQQEMGFLRAASNTAVLLDQYLFAASRLHKTT